MLNYSKYIINKIFYILFGYYINNIIFDLFLGYYIIFNICINILLFNK